MQKKIPHISRRPSALIQTHSPFTRLASLTLCLLLAGCGQDRVIQVQADNSKQISNENSLDNPQAHLKAWDKLITDPSGSPLLAYQLRSLEEVQLGLASQNPQSKTTTHNPQKTQSEMQQIHDRREEEISHILWEGSVLSQDPELQKKLLSAHPHFQNAAQQALHAQTQQSLEAQMIQNSQRQILLSWDQRAKDLARIEALHLLNQMNPQMQKSIESLAGKEKRQISQEIHEILRTWPQALQTLQAPLNKSSTQLNTSPPDSAEKFQRSDVSRSDVSRSDVSRSTHLLLLYISDSLAPELQQSSSFDELRQKLQQKIPTQTPQRLTPEFASLALGIYESSRIPRQRVSELESAFQEFRQGLQNLQAHSRISRPEILQKQFSLLFEARNPSQIESELRQLQSKSKEDSLSPDAHSLLNYRIKVSSSALKITKIAADTSTQVDQMIQVGTQLAHRFGVRISPEVQKNLRQIQDINRGIRLGQKVVQAISTGGVSAALSLFTSQEGAQLLAPLGFSGGGDPATLAAIGDLSERVGRMEKMMEVIDAKLDQVLLNQERIFETQKLILNSIRDLSHLVMAHHEVVMAEFLDTRKNLHSLQEMIRHQNNRGIESCEALSQVPYLEPRVSPQATSESNSPNLLPLDPRRSLNAQGQFERSLGSYQKLAARLKSELQRTHWSQCQTDLAMAFSSRAIYPLHRFRFQSSADVFDLAEHRLQSLLKLPQTKEKIKRAQSLRTLHAPPLFLQDWEKKSHYLESALLDKSESYDLQNSVYAAALERRVNQLLLLGTLFDFPFSPNLSFSEATEIYLEHRKDNASTPQTLLWNALAQVQSAIAQESILAGELSLEELRPELQRAPLEATAPELRNGSSPQRILGDNPWLGHNLVLYQLYLQQAQDPTWLSAYTSAFKAQDIPRLSALSKMKVTLPPAPSALASASASASSAAAASPSPQVQVGWKLECKYPTSESGVSNRLQCSLSSEEPQQGLVLKPVLRNLPPPETLQKFELQYSDNLPRLLHLQRRIVQSLVWENSHSMGDETRQQIRSLWEGLPTKLPRPSQPSSQEPSSIKTRPTKPRSNSELKI